MSDYLQLLASGRLLDILLLALMTGICTASHREFTNKTQIGRRNWCCRLQCHASAPQQIPDGLFYVIPTLVHGIGREVFSRRAVDIQSSKLQHFFYAIDMVSIAHYDDRMEPHSPHDFACHGCGFHSALAFGLGDDRFGGHATADQIRPSHSAFGVDRIASGPAGRHDKRGKTAVVKFEGVV